jgi:uncharacterized NAD(P)/FAD-binding protein YdhS
MEGPMRGKEALLDLFRRWDLQDDPPSLAAMTATLAGLDVERFDVEGLLRFGEEGYRRVSIRRTDRYEALLICWRSGQRSPIHNHTGSACVARVLAGRATETLFQRSALGVLFPARSRIIPGGSLMSCGGDGVHQVANLEPAGRDLVTLHVYSPPLSGYRRFSIEETSVHTGRCVAQDIAIPIRAEATTEPDGGSVASGMASVPPGPPKSPISVAIIGGGFSGTMVAANLARRAVPGQLHATLWEKGARLGRGLAYGTRCDRHRLNVPAGNMSAFPDEPSHFLRWLRQRDPEASADAFAPRRLYGDYLEDTLQESRRQGAVTVDTARDEVTDVRGGPDGGYELITREGGIVRADWVVLATGHLTPGHPFPADAGPVETGHYRGDPWAPDVLDELDPDAPLLLIGTGLTAIDLAVEARARGHSGMIHLLSRHGLIPRRHQAQPAHATPPAPHFSLLGPIPDTARALFRMVRRAAEGHAREQGDWRPIIDAMRPVTQAMWAGLAPEERRRFLRHLASRWDVHRHRVAPEIDERIQSDIRAGRLAIIAGRVLALKDRDDRAEVTIRRRGEEGPSRLIAARVINCTGPGKDFRAGPPALLSSLMRRGLARPGPLGLGPEVSPLGELIDREGRVQPRLLTLGPPRREQLWETTAVRELRTQAAELAAHLLGTIGAPAPPAGARAGRAGRADSRGAG